MRKNNHQYWKNNSTTHQPRQTTRNRDREMAPSELTVRQEHSANGTAAFAETLVALCILHELTCSNHCTWKRSGGLCCRYSFATGQRGRSFRPISLVISCNQGSTEVRWRPGQDTSLNLRSFGSKYIVLEKVVATLLELFGDFAVFRHPRSDSVPGDLCPSWPT